MSNDNKKQNSGFLQVCSLVAKANGNCTMDCTKDGLLLTDASFYGAINGLEFDCGKIEVCKNGIIFLDVVQNCQLAKKYNTQNKGNMVGFHYKQIQSLIIDDIERLIYD